MDFQKMALTHWKETCGEWWLLIKAKTPITERFDDEVGKFTCKSIIITEQPRERLLHLKYLHIFSPESGSPNTPSNAVVFSRMREKEAMESAFGYWGWLVSEEKLDGFLRTPLTQWYPSWERRVLLQSQCQYCPASLSRSSGRKRHEEEHTKKTYFCKICLNRSYPTQKLLDDHYLSTHKINLTHQRGQTLEKGRKCLENTGETLERKCGFEPARPPKKPKQDTTEAVHPKHPLLPKSLEYRLEHTGHLYPVAEERDRRETAEGPKTRYLHDHSPYLL
jgi:hypothetical protein